MKKFKKYINKFSQYSNQGYTLLELLIASVLTTFIIGISGFGLQMSLQNNQKAQVDSTVFSHVNKTLDFMSDEIRSAIKVESDVADALANQTSLSLPSESTPVLALQMPGVAERVIYYVHKPNDSGKASEVLYRWGPSFDENGDYKADEIKNPKGWKSAALTNLIDSEIIVTPKCQSSDWKSNPPSNAKGFYSCVNTKSPGLVQLNITSSVEPSVSQAVSKNIGTTVFARAALKEGITAKYPDYNILGKTLTLDEPAKITFKVLGGAITCGAGGPTVPVTTNLYLDNNTNPESWNTSQPLTMPTLPKGTTITVESIADAPFCGGYWKKVSSNDSQSALLVVLRDGDPVPDITPFDNQTTIDNFLKSYIDLENDKIKLEPNEVIYLFELGTNNPQSSAFDLQDNVVLATIESP